LSAKGLAMKLSGNHKGNPVTKPVGFLFFVSVFFIAMSSYFSAFSELSERKSEQPTASETPATARKQPEIRIAQATYNAIPVATTSGFSITSWNVRGYPEKDIFNRMWFQSQLVRMGSQVIAVQEIANDDRVRTFISSESGYSQAAFADSSDGQDNAIFATSAVTFQDIDLEPTDFQHPAQAALISYGGFDAIILTVHLTWTNVEWREREKVSLQSWVPRYLAIDPDLIILGDFNTKEIGIQELADSIGMVVMVPSGQTGVGTTHAGNRYDHFLISPDLANEEAVEARIVTFSGSELTTAKQVSDHLPVTAWFQNR
jgi:exonuclease III